MRDLLLALLADADLGTFTLSQELPYDSSGTPLYLKSVKRVFVDQEQISTEPIIETLDGLDILRETRTVDVYMTCDAKVRPADYGQTVLNIRSLRRSNWNQAVTVTVGITTEYEADLLVTRFEFAFSGLLPITL